MHEASTGDAVVSLVVLYNPADEDKQYGFRFAFRFTSMRPLSSRGDGSNCLNPLTLRGLTTDSRRHESDLALNKTGEQRAGGSRMCVAGGVSPVSVSGQVAFCRFEPLGLSI